MLFTIVNLLQDAIIFRWSIHYTREKTWKNGVVYIWTVTSNNYNSYFIAISSVFFVRNKYCRVATWHLFIQWLKIADGTFIPLSSDFLKYCNKLEYLLLRSFFLKFLLKFFCKIDIGGLSCLFHKRFCCAKAIVRRACIYYLDRWHAKTNSCDQIFFHAIRHRMIF